MTKHTVFALFAALAVACSSPSDDSSSQGPKTGLTARPAPYLTEKAFFVLDTASAFTAPAVGTVTCDTNANQADTDTVTLSDGVVSRIYEYDKAANGVTAGRVSWAAGTTAATVCANLRTAILGATSAFTVVDNSGSITITNNWPGAAGNVASAKSSASALAVTGMTGGQGNGSGNTVTTTAKRWKTKGRAFRVDRVVLDVPAGFTQDASNYWTVAVKDGATTMAQWATQTSQQGTVAADTPVDLVLSATDANLVAAAGDTLSVVITKTGSPAAFPTAVLVIDGKYL